LPSPKRQTPHWRPPISRRGEARVECPAWSAPRGVCPQPTVISAHAGPRRPTVPAHARGPRCRPTAPAHAPGPRRRPTLPAHGAMIV
jgi:hypothetical protein